MRIVAYFSVVLAVLLAASPVAAQFGAPAVPCPEGTGEATLRGLNVEAALFTNGNLFFGNTTTNGDGYIVPLAGEGAGNSPLFASNLWIGGRVGGEVRTAAARYNGFQLRPGLTGADGAPPDTTACAAADRIWTLSILKPRDSQEADYRDWPVHLGAPVIDGDGIEGNYDLAAGDRPAIRGDAMAFWAMTDTATERVPYGTPAIQDLPLGVDVTAEAFTFLQLPTTTFYRFTVTNRNSVPIEGAALGIFSDWDLGDAADDYVGTDTTRHMAYIYNADASDAAYGIAPASGIVVARGPLADANGVDDDGDGVTDESGERMGLTASPVILKSGGLNTYGAPTLPSAYYNRLLGLSGDGTDMYEYRYGFNFNNDIPSGTPTTRFAYTGDPVNGSFWSEKNIDRAGTTSPSGDRRGFGATGPVRLEPGASMDATFAIVFSQGEDNLDSVRRLQGQAEIVHRIAETGAFDLQPFTYLEGTTPEAPTEIVLTRPRPNPFTGTTTLTLTGASGANARVNVYDVLGRRLSVTEMPDAPEAEVEVGAGLASGVYVVRVEGLGFAETFTVVKAK